jgi:hypothetical protein
VPVAADAAAHRAVARADAARPSDLTSVVLMPNGPSPAPPGQTRAVPTVLAAAFLALALWTVGITLWMERIAYTALPWGDHWDHWRTVLADGYSLDMLFAQHNEHRILTARVLFWLDEHLFGATNTFVFAAILLVQGLHALLLWRLGARASGQAGAASVALAGLSLTMMFAAHQFSNFTWAFQVQFVLVFLLANVTFYLLLRDRDQAARAGGLPGAWFVGAVAAAWATTFTMANGLVVWPLLLALAACLRAPRGRVAVLALNAAVAWALYLWDFHTPPHHGSMIDGLRQLPKSLAFTAAYVGSPVDATVTFLGLAAGPVVDAWRVPLAVTAGTVGGLLALRHVVRAIIDPASARGAQLALLSGLGFTLASALMTGLGRAPTFPLTEAMTSRYLTPALVFWACLAMLAWAEASAPGEEGERPRAGWRFGSTLLLLLIVFIGAPQYPRLDHARGFVNYLNEAEAAMVANVYDKQLWGRYYYAPDTLPTVLDYFREHDLSVFRQDWTAWPGQRFASLFDDRSGAECLGSFDEVSPIASARPGFRFQGWAWDVREQQGAARVVFVDESGLVLGSTSVVQTRPDVVLALPATVPSPEVGWLGYAPSTSASRVDAFLIREDDRSGCKIGSIAVPSSIALAPIELVGAIYEGARFEASPGWTPNGTYPDIGPVPLPGPAYGSWSGSDANTGTLRIGPIGITERTSSIAVPLVTGPVVRDLSLVLSDKTTGEVLVTLAPPPASQTWSVIQIEFPARQVGTELEIVANDAGAGWGQWMALGAPRHVSPR